MKMNYEDKKDIDDNEDHEFGLSQHFCAVFQEEAGWIAREKKQLLRSEEWKKGIRYHHVMT